MKEQVHLVLLQAAWNKSAMTLSMAMFPTVFRKKMASKVLAGKWANDGRTSSSLPNLGPML
jgi:hypothetical protein